MLRAAQGPGAVSDDLVAKAQQLSNDLSDLLPAVIFFVDAFLSRPLIERRAMCTGASCLPFSGGR